MGLIYCYTNKINGKQYVGQTTTSLERRDYGHQHQPTPKYFHAALKKYGRENFDLDVLEECSNELLDEREEFWIKKLGTFGNGYNLNSGGKQPKYFQPEQIAEIKDLLINTRLPYTEIKSRTGISIWTISDINLGLHSFESGTNYPLRKIPSSYKYSLQVLQEIAEMLQNTTLTHQEIAETFQVPKTLVDDVNIGKKQKLQGYSFPIREPKTTRSILNKKLVEQIIQTIKTTHYTWKEIADLYFINDYTVGAIARGNSSWCKLFPEESFPLRKSLNKNQNSNSLETQQVIEICYDLIFSKETLKDIGNKFGRAKNTINDISRGLTFKKITHLFILPIRQNQRKNQKIYNEIAWDSLLP